MVSGEVSVNKLSRVAAIATKENEETWAEQVKILPQSALETLVRDERKFSENETSGLNFQKKLNKNFLNTSKKEST